MQSTKRCLSHALFSGSSQNQSITKKEEEVRLKKQEFRLERQRESPKQMVRRGDPRMRAASLSPDWQLDHFWNRKIEPWESLPARENWSTTWSLNAIRTFLVKMVDWAYSHTSTAFQNFTKTTARELTHTQDRENRRGDHSGLFFKAYGRKRIQNHNGERKEPTMLHVEKSQKLRNSGIFRTGDEEGRSQDKGTGWKYIAFSSPLN